MADKGLMINTGKQKKHLVVLPQTRLMSRLNGHVVSARRESIVTQLCAFIARNGCNDVWHDVMASEVI